MAEGIITRKDLITDEALNFGTKYAENVELAIKKNDELRESAKEMFQVYGKLQKSTTQQQFLDAKRQEALALIKSKNAIKEKEEALKSIERVKRESLKTDRARTTAQKAGTAEVKKSSVAWKEQDQLEKSLISTKKKRALATESTSRAVIKEREALRLENLEVKRSLTFMGQLTSKRDRARKSIQELQAKLKLGYSLSDREQKELAESTGGFQKYQKQIDAIRNSTNQFQENVGNYPQLFKNVGSSIKQLLPVLGIAGALRATFGALRDATRTVREFDRQLIAVQKTTNLSSPEIKLLGKEVRDLGLELKGVSIQGLLESAEVAGQLGVKGRANILGFSKAIEILKISAKGLTEEDVASFAKFIEVSKDSAENADRLSSVVTILGNNFATTEKEVIKSAIEIQKGVQIYDVSAQAVLGLAGATTALGVQDAAARTSIRKSFGVIQQAIFTGKNLTEVLQLTGLTQEELSEQFEKDATGTFIKFLKGLDGITTSGGNTQAILEKMMLAGDRVAPTLLSLASKHDLVSDAVGKSNQEYIDNTAALNEAELAAQSLDVKIGDLGDAWDGFILSLESGDGKIARVFKNLIGFLEGAVKGLILFNESFKEELDGISESQKDSSFQVEIDFLTSLDSKDAEEFAISQLDRTDELIEKERERLAILKAQKKEIEDNRGAVAGTFDGTDKGLIFSKRRRLSNEIEESTRTLAAYEGKLKAFDQVLGITGETIEGETESVSENTKETVRNVKAIEDQIAAERKKLKLTTTRSEASFIQDNIKDLEKEREAILGVAKAHKTKNKAAADAFNLKKTEVQINIQDERADFNDEDLTGGQRLSANLNYFIESKKLLELERDEAIRLAGERTDAIKAIELQYTQDLKNLGIEQSKNAEGILKDSFEKAKERIDDKKELEEAALNQNIVDLESILQGELRRTDLTNEEKRKLVEEHEKAILDLKRNYAIKNVEVQISQIELELENATLSFEQRKILEEQLAALKIALSEATTDSELANLKKKEEAEQKLADFKSEKIKEASGVIADALNLDAGNLENLFSKLTDGFENALDAVQAVSAVAGDVVNSIFDQNISNIDAQIRKSEDYYNRQYELASGDRDQQDLIRQEQELKRQELEKKKRNEQVKQAKFQKLNAATQIAFSTAQAILGIWAQVPKFDFGISAGLLTGFVSALGAAQIAAVLAKPIPKYAQGTEDHPGGLAEVAEHRAEVIKEPGKDPYIQRKRAILDLPKKTKVYKSEEHYAQIQRASILTSFDVQHQRLNSYEAGLVFDYNNDDVVHELRLNRKAMEKIRLNVKQETIDIDHQLFRAQNLN